MKILILGAAFDPPHNGHMTMARQVIEKGIADKVILMPCGNHAFAKNMSSASDRYAMTKIMFAELIKGGSENFELSDLEIRRSGVSYAWDTLETIAQINPEMEVGWLMGSDQLRNFSKWYKYQEILANYPAYVYPRKNYPLEPWYSGMIEIKDVPEIEISSSEIRAKYLNGNTIDGLVLPSLADYIKEKRLWIK
jgi:nicotinate-nucleotide adenylyltransferase